MSVPPGMGAGYGGRTTGIICQEDTGQKEVVRESLCATVVSGYRLSSMQSLTGPAHASYLGLRAILRGRLERRI